MNTFASHAARGHTSDSGRSTMSKRYLTKHREPLWIWSDAGCLLAVIALCFAWAFLASRASGQLFCPDSRFPIPTDCGGRITGAPDPGPRVGITRCSNILGEGRTIVGLARPEQPCRIWNTGRGAVYYATETVICCEAEPDAPPPPPPPPPPPLGDDIFADGFERGDLRAWSGSTP